MTIILTVCRRELEGTGEYCIHGKVDDSDDDIFDC